MLEQFFQTLPLPANHINGTYSIRLVILSYLVATIASYVALDISHRMKDSTVGKLEHLLWFVGGSIAMGAGIWSMHFIGMLAFIMPMPMLYDLNLTIASIIVAIIASGLAFSLLRSKTISRTQLILGGVVLGFAIAAMHYTGMAAMTISMHIRYLPSIFILSILIAIFASEAALYLATKGAEPSIKHPFALKLVSALVMGAAICGMHYMGMAAAVFTPLDSMPSMGTAENPDTISVMIAMATIFILGIAILISSAKDVLAQRYANLARQSGMAEVASSVLHNVGNVLNSVNVSASLIKSHLQKIEIDKLQNVNQLINEHQHDLGAFFSTDPKGLRVPNYLNKLAGIWGDESKFLNEEIARLEQNIRHIKEIISIQQSFSTQVSFDDLVSLESVISNALTLTAIDFPLHQIAIKKKYGKLKPIYGDQFKLAQVLVNLIKNAKEALTVSANDDKLICFKSGAIDADYFFIQVIDNGIGIDKAQADKVFTYGFTTKKTGHGFGLHSSINIIRQMKGSLSVDSQGINQGAIFTIKLPYKNNTKGPTE